MRALIYVKGAGPAQIVIPLIKLLELKNHVCDVIADGPAVSPCKDAGIVLEFGGPSGKIEYDSFSPAFAYNILTAYNPDVLILAPNGGPYMSEKGLFEGAQRAHVPIVLIEDFWGNAKRLHGKADLYLVLDEYAELLVRREFKHPSHVAVSIIGNHAAVSVTPSKEAVRFFKRLKEKFDHVLCYCGGGVEATGSELQLLAESIEKSSFSSWCILPRFHSGYAKNFSPSGKAWGSIWNEMLFSFGFSPDQVVFTDGFKTEEVVALSDVTFGGYSADFAKAVHAGKKAVSLFTEETKENMMKESGLSEVPLVYLGCAEKIETPVDLVTILNTQNRAILKLRPYDPNRAYEALRNLLC